MKKLVSTLFLVLYIASTGRSQDSVTDRSDFGARLGQLEAENRILRTELGKLNQSIKTPSPEASLPTSVKLVDQASIPLVQADDDQERLAALESGQQQLAGGLARIQGGLEDVGKNLKITTVDKSWGIGIFGSLNTEALFAQARPLTPSAPLFILPDFGRDTQTFNVHAHSTNFGVALQGPQVGDLKAGGLFLTYLWGEQFEADRYGFFIARAYGELKNDDVRYSFGLDGDVMNPISPTMINFNAGQLGGNFGFFRAQIRRERYHQLGNEVRLTTQFAVSDPVTTSFADFTVPPNRLLEDAGWPLLQGRIALGLGPNEGPQAQKKTTI
jgi:hypothetical protein